MCAKVDKLRWPRSQSYRAAARCALMTHPGSFSATSESQIVSGCSPFRMGPDSHERYVHTTRPHYDAIIAAVEAPCPFLTKLTKVN